VSFGRRRLSDAFDCRGPSGPRGSHSCCHCRRAWADFGDCRPAFAGL